MAAASLRSAMMFSTRRPKSCFGLRCNMVTSWPPFTSSSTSSRPMKRVPPITSTFIFSARYRTGHPACPDRPGGLSYKIQALVVIFQAQMRNQIFTPHPAEGVFQLHELDEDVMLRIDLGCMHGAL